MTDPRIEAVTQAVARTFKDWGAHIASERKFIEAISTAALTAADSGQEPVAYLVVSDCGESHVEKLHLKKSDAERDAENFNAFGHAERTKIHPLYASPPLPSSAEPYAWAYEYEVSEGDWVREIDFDRQPGDTVQFFDDGDEFLVRNVTPLFKSPPLPSREAVADWQPIETAPRTPNLSAPAIDFLAWCPDPTARFGGDRRVVWWEPGLKKWWGDRDIEEHPTHWMPLPPSPDPAHD